MNCNIQSSVIAYARNIISPPPTIDIQIHQYSNNRKYKYVHVYVYMHVRVRIGVFSLRKCYTQLFGAHPKYAYKNKDM
jgi:hypothetical protein